MVNAKWIYSAILFNFCCCIFSSGADGAAPFTGSRTVHEMQKSGSTNQDTALEWNRWEHTLISSRSYPNPYMEVNVSITYHGPNGENITGHGFWDGDNNFKIRNMFPQAGVWSWKTICSDPSNSGLHNQHGTVVVSTYTGENLLYDKGYLKISNDRRYLVYDDDTPFFWLADTPWSALIAATQAEWEAYVQKRKSQHFNAIQVHSRDGWIGRKTDRDGNAPFIKGSDSTLCWNPAYWQGVDRKVQYANDQGVIVFFAAVRQPGPGVPETDTIQVRLFARNLAARMMGNHVVYSPVADDLWSGYADISGEALAAATSVHLITAHPRFKWEPAEIFHGKAYIDFAGLQTGSGWKHDPYFKEPYVPHNAPLAAQQAIEWPLALYRKRPTKPVLELEAAYDTKALRLGEIKWYEQPYPGRMPRSTAYLSILNGAKGFTYGIFGIWNWGFPLNWGGAVWTFDEALAQPSGNEMRYLFELFSGLVWWRLEPKPELIRNQPEDWLKKMAFAVTPDGSQGVAYLQDTSEIRLDMSNFARPMKARWFNPASNTWQSVAEAVVNSSIQTIIKPADWEDAVLVLETITE